MLGDLGCEMESREGWIGFQVWTCVYTLRGKFICYFYLSFLCKYEIWSLIEDNLHMSTRYLTLE